MYEWIKVLHILAVISWMAGFLYLPRLFVYHCDAEIGSIQSETFKVMERRLLRGIMNPAMIIAWGAGLYLLIEGGWISEGWMQVKLLSLIFLTILHMVVSKWRKNFEIDANTKSPKFYRIANEVPAVLMVIIVIMVIIKPF